MIKDNKLTIENINYKLINQVNVENEANNICEIEEERADKTASYLNPDVVFEKQTYGIKNFMNKRHSVDSLENGEMSPNNVLLQKQSVNYVNKTSEETFDGVNQRGSRSSGASFHADINNDIMTYVNNIGKDVNPRKDYEIDTCNNLSSVHILNDAHIHERESVCGEAPSSKVNLATLNIGADTASPQNAASSIIQKCDRLNRHSVESINNLVDPIADKKIITHGGAKSPSRRAHSGFRPPFMNQQMFQKSKCENPVLNMTSIHKEVNVDPARTKEEAQKENPDVTPKVKKLEIFKNYSQYEIMNVLCSKWNTERSSESLPYPGDVSQSEEKINDEKNPNEENDTAKVKVSTNDDLCPPPSDHSQIYTHSENSNSSTKRREEILQLLFHNIETKELDDIAKNLSFLKRMQQYFYQKYINIKFPNDSNDYHYYIHLDWFNKLKAFIFTPNGEFPGCITNYKLYNEEESDNESISPYMLNKKHMKSNLKEGKDYICTNQYMWRFLHFLFRGGPCIKRNSNNIYDRYVPISNSDLMNKNIIYMMEPQYVDNLFSTFNYSKEGLWSDTTHSGNSLEDAQKSLLGGVSPSDLFSPSSPINGQIASASEAAIKHRTKQCAHNYYEFLFHYGLKEKEYSSSFFLEYDESNPRIMNKMIDLKNKNSYESVYSFYSNENDTFSDSAIVHEVYGANAKSDPSELSKKETPSEKEKNGSNSSVTSGPNRTGATSAEKVEVGHMMLPPMRLSRKLSDNVKSASVGNEGGNSNGKDGSSNGNGGNTNGNRGSGDANGGSSNGNGNNNNNSNNSSNNNSNNSNNNNSNSNNNNNNKKNNDSNNNKKNAQEEDPQEENQENAEETATSTDVKTENKSDNATSYFGPKANIGTPSILSGNYTYTKSNASKASSNKSGNPSNNRPISSGKALLTPPPKKNSLGYHSSNGNEIYKSCEEYNADNGEDASSNGYLTTTETESKGTTDNSIKSATSSPKGEGEPKEDVKKGQICKDGNKQRRGSTCSRASIGSNDSNDSSSGANGAIPKKVSTERNGATADDKRTKRKEEYQKNFNTNKQPTDGNSCKVLDRLNTTLNTANLMLKGYSSCSSNSSSYRGSSSGSSVGSSNNHSSNGSSNASSNFSIRNHASSNRSMYNDRERIKNMIASSNHKRESEFNNNCLSMITAKEQPAGLVNYSATCYINVVLQCLSVQFKLIYTLQNYVNVKYKNMNVSSEDTDNMNSSFINKNFFTNSIPFNLFGNNNKKKDECLLLTLSHKLFQLSKMHNKGKVLNVNKLLNLLNDKYSYLFEYNEQQDCHEFLLLLFDFIHNMMKVVDETVDKNNKIDYCLKKEQSIISDLFLGLIEEKITCSQCNYVNYVYQPVYNLSVNVFKKNAENNLNDNLVEYFKKEEVNSTCEKCKCKKMYKHSCVYKQPNVLIVHLIRLLEDGSKIDNPIKFDLNDFTIQNVLKKKNGQYIENPKKYSLFGVIVHRGLNSNYGHYICYTKRRHSNGATVWYKFDDSIVTVVDVSEVESAKAYCLFYEAVN
ncbi:Ubiquitin carboxyl-terminal hydrolase [Plasmodium coatneyi]|uniref:Ubiquitin carboxyl-terminal hydrolase n=1 Tax=Plasmodium coatneyi TaxID=208452 RepID=A0A1B1DX45_9APIC|nr:Ubiquitin carboxyl-terminal hydrolase [Plasmodium coatneyi]ANQ07352.1 Ubiquitin carboxyl-terminal hydrolase [Plasmodium coatneyi]